MLILVLTFLSAATAVNPSIKSSHPIYSERFEKAFTNLLKEEGGYSNDVYDPGGETKYGISKRSYPHLNIKNLTQEQAKQIYYRDFWIPLHGDRMPSDEVGIELLEQGVNMGIRRAVYFIQSTANACGHRIEVDGDLGPQTINAVVKCNPQHMLVSIRAQALTYYRELTMENPTFKRYLKGWFNRVLT